MYTLKRKMLILFVTNENRTEITPLPLNEKADI